MKYKVLLFDADGTLFDYDKGEEYALKNALEEFSISYDEDIHLTAYRDINFKIWEEFEQKLISADKLKVERFRRYFEFINVDIDEYKFSTSYLKHLSNATFLLEGAFDLLSSIHKDFNITIITNGLTSVQKPRFEQSAINDFIDENIISEEFGIPKPNIEIFEHAMERINHKDKSSVLMIGDKISSDILGGKSFGIDTCWYNPSESKNEADIAPTYEIKYLKELKQILS